MPQSYHERTVDLSSVSLPHEIILPFETREGWKVTFDGSGLDAAPDITLSSSPDGGVNSTEVVGSTYPQPLPTTEPLAFAGDKFRERNLHILIESGAGATTGIITIKFSKL